MNQVLHIEQSATTKSSKVRSSYISSVGSPYSLKGIIRWDGLIRSESAGFLSMEIIYITRLFRYFIALIDEGGDK